MIGQAIGFEMSRTSADYNHLYHGEAALLAESLEVIQRTAAVPPAADAEAKPSEAIEEAQLAEAA